MAPDCQWPIPSSGWDWEVPAGPSSLDGGWKGWPGLGRSGWAPSTPCQNLLFPFASLPPTPLQLGHCFLKTPSQHPLWVRLPTTILMQHCVVSAHMPQSHCSLQSHFCVRLSSMGSRACTLGSPSRTWHRAASSKLGGMSSAVFPMGWALGCGSAHTSRGLVSPWEVYFVFRESRSRDLEPRKDFGWGILKPVLLGAPTLSPGARVSGKYPRLQAPVDFALEAETPRQDAVTANI